MKMSTHHDEATYQTMTQRLLLDAPSKTAMLAPISQQPFLLMKMLSFILASVVTFCQGQSLETLLATQCKTYDLPSVSAVVFHEGKIIESACHGLRRRGFPEQVTLNDRYHLGSITKSMTSSLAAIIVEEKKISWDDSIEKILGKSLPKIHADYRDVTLRQLCEHRGGMPTHRNDELWAQLYERSKTVSPEKNRAWFIGELLKQAPAQKPGTYVYSNFGYMAAGLMLETVTGEAWETLIKEKLFTPLGMDSAGFGAAATSESPISQPWPHREGKEIFPGLKADNPAALGPAGTVHCSIGDLATYCIWHLPSGKTNCIPKLSAESFSLLHHSRYYEKNSGGYALGWNQVPRPWADGDALTHNGTNTMNYAVIWLAPQKNFGVAVCCNEGANDVAKATDEVVAAMIHKHLMMQKKHPSPQGKISP